VNPEDAALPHELLAGQDVAADPDVLSSQDLVGDVLSFALAHEGAGWRNSAEASREADQLIDNQLRKRAWLRRSFTLSTINSFRSGLTALLGKER